MIFRWTLHDFFQQRHVRLRAAFGHRRVIRAAQTDGDDAFVILVPPDAFAPEVFKDVRVFGVVPSSQCLLIPPVPFLLRPEHRLLMRGAHDDAVFIREPGIFRIVFVEGVVPHGRPEVVALQPQNQLEQLRVKLVVVIGHARRDGRIGIGGDQAEFVGDPIAQVRRFVIQEDAAIFDRRRALEVFARFYKQRVFVLGGDVRPPIPRRYAHLLGQIINAVDGSPLVAAHDDQRAGDAGQGIGHDLDEKRFPLAERSARHQFSLRGSSGQ